MDDSEPARNRSTVPSVPPPSPPNPYGAYAAVDALGGVSAPLLAGFAVTLAALVLQVVSALRWPDLALGLLGLGAILLLQVIQLNARARGYAVTPGQAREWYQDFDDPERRKVVFWEMRHHRRCWNVLVRRARVMYNLGILAVLLGIMVMLVPRDPDELTGGRLVAIAVIGVGVGVESMELAGQRLDRARPGRTPGRFRTLLAWVVPAEPPLPPTPFPAGSPGDWSSHRD